MSDHNRLDPDALLNSLKKQQQSDHEASLRIFLGMCAGVGKTYAMLKSAHQLISEGKKVVVGVVESHGRKETAELLSGLPVIPLMQSTYRGSIVEEMDLDAILSAKPDWVIVDELAHTNAPGSRHEKRYQDVLELLDAGISVYTALNVQHLESRKDAVEAISGIVIRETVPDSLLERATSVELVDIAPAELLKRLKEGKVYLGERANWAAQNFFKEDKLTALREIALRMTAERVDHDLQRLTSARQQNQIWKINERILVAFSHSPSSEKLIRAARRISYNLEAPWIALYVDTGHLLSDSDQAQLIRNINLARDLKAEVITTTEANIVEAIHRIAKQKNVTQVIVGRPTKRWFRDLFSGGTLLDRLVVENREIDVYVLGQELLALPISFKFQGFSLKHLRSPFVYYWNVLWFITAVTFASAILETYIGYRAVGFLYLLAVLLIGLFHAVGPVILAAGLSAFLWNFCFIPPKFSFTIQEPDDILLCATYFVVALITGFLTSRIRFHERVLREREERTQTLYDILKDITESAEQSEFLQKVIEKINFLFEAQCSVILKSELNELIFQDTKWSEKDRAVATWVFLNRKNAGWSTETLSQNKAMFLPLLGQEEVMGVFVFQPKIQRKLNLENETMLFSAVSQIAQALERNFIAKRAQENQQLRQSEQLHQTLLNSISHEMRTPLTAILTSASTLSEEVAAIHPEKIKKISFDLQDAGQRLNRVIENLLDMSRINSGMLTLHLEWHDLHDLLGVLIKKMKPQMQQHVFRMEVDEDIPFIRVDFRLMEHALANILSNAFSYTPPGTNVIFRANVVQNLFVIEIEDHGSGLSDVERNKIFEKFYRAPGTPAGGTGLGLSIVKSIVELHQGKIRADKVAPSGLKFTIELPFHAPPKTSKVSE